MKQTEFLRLQIALLMRQYGERAVLASLADLKGVDLEAILVDIDKVGRSRGKAPPSAIVSTSSLESLLAEHPEKAGLILSIKSRFEDRTLLTELKDVRRFLDRHGQSTASLKTRHGAFPRIARVLVDLPISDLDEILNANNSSEISGLGLISDQILGRE